MLWNDVAFNALLARDDIDVNVNSNSACFTALYWAISEGKEAMAKALIQRPDTNVNITDYFRRSLLQVAVLHAETGIIE